MAIAVWRLAPTLAHVPNLGARLIGLGWGWLMLALMLALASLADYGELHRRLLMAGGAHVSGVTVQAITFIGNAVTQAVPSGGSLAGGGYSVVALQRRGVDAALSVWTVAMGILLTSMSMAVMAPLCLAAGQFLSVPVAVALSGVVAALCWAGWRAMRHPHAVDAIARGVVAVAHRLPVLRHTDWPTRQSERVNQFAQRIGHLQPRPVQWVVFVVAALATWTLDYLALAACVAATGSVIPWAAVAVGYLIVQISIGLELTPGGTGPAEAGLLAALISGGMPAGSAAIVVVVYRILTLLVLALLGWAVFLGVAMRRAYRRADQSTETP
ncbi:MAG TPA: lysylphosphatidylglycerol synthase transmembrane domain-containing protein [Pseudonocardiaceae bacterium]|nr:lysylphosphatidylglycerol synthase transmembrane domain-containing protein [Pseudonocardiaceae bacterium]